MERKGVPLSRDWSWSIEYGRDFDILPNENQVIRDSVFISDRNEVPNWIHNPSGRSLITL
jgi:hypothetical protein